MLTDYHVHTTLCKHASGDIESYILAAIDKGLSEIAFTDHIPFFRKDQNNDMHRMALEEFETYYSMVKAMQEKYKDRISILYGIEAEYELPYIDVIKQILLNNKFDLIIGSVHAVYDMEKSSNLESHKMLKSDKRYYSEYYKMLHKMACSGLFHILGHFDKSVIESKVNCIDCNPFKNEWYAALEAVAQNGLVLEVNTSAFRKMASIPYLSQETMHCAKELGIRWTITSDAHKPEDVGSNYSLAIDYLHKFSFDSIVRRVGKNWISVPC